MSRQPELDYEDVEQYLRTFSTATPHNDFGALLGLVLVGIENLRNNAVDGDILENAHSITDGQASFLRQLLDGRAESLELFVNEITHTSQTGQL
jgi:hypothetical protein